MKWKRHLVGEKQYNLFVKNGKMTQSGAIFLVNLKLRMSIDSINLDENTLNVYHIENEEKNSFILEYNQVKHK